MVSQQQKRYFPKGQGQQSLDLLVLASLQPAAGTYRNRAKPPMHSKSKKTLKKLVPLECMALHKPEDTLATSHDMSQ
jgi:hypothetical protein